MTTETEIKTFRQRLEWDADKGEIVDGSVRYLLIRPDTLMSMFALLPPEPRAQALAALMRSTRQFGANSARRYLSMAAEDGERLLATITQTAPQLGWGIWTLSRDGDRAFSLEVGNSPFAAGYGPAEHPVCAPIAGMLAAVTGLVTGVAMQGEEIACAATGAAVCRFRATPAPWEGFYES